jgi:hypothetical protein
MRTLHRGLGMAGTKYNMAGTKGGVVFLESARQLLPGLAHRTDDHMEK